MTLVKPLFLEAVGGDAAITFSAQEFRTLVDGLVIGSGVSFTSDLAVTQRGAGANFSVDVAAGHAVIAGTSVADQGKYVVQNTATLNVTIAGAPGSSTRTDLVYAQVRDKQSDGGANYDFVIDKITGTLGAGTPATPANAIPLATVGPIVPGTASITTSLITDARPRAQPIGNVTFPQWRSADYNKKILTGTIASAAMTAGSRTGSVTFSTAFATAPVVLLTPSIGSGTVVICLNGTPSTTGFNWVIETNDTASASTAAVFAFWIAIGT